MSPPTPRTAVEADRPAPLDHAPGVLLGRPWIRLVNASETSPAVTGIVVAGIAVTGIIDEIVDGEMVVEMLAA